MTLGRLRTRGVPCPVGAIAWRREPAGTVWHDVLVGFRQPWALDRVVEALEELRVVDRLLTDVHATARTYTPAYGALAAGSRLSLPTPLPGYGDLADAQDRDDVIMAEAMQHLLRAVELTGGLLWNGGISEQGTPWLLHTSVGLRHAAREYFERLLAHDRVRLARVPPLTPLEPGREGWKPSTAFAVVLLVPFVATAVTLLISHGVPPLAFALAGLLLIWSRVRRRQRRELAAGAASVALARRDEP